ncbi:MAG: ankyrin repeat domain-containing protein [Pseudomonadota bacterium]
MDIELATRLLGVEKGASAREVEEAYQRKWAEAEGRMKSAATELLRRKYAGELHRINEAYDVCMAAASGDSDGSQESSLLPDATNVPSSQPADPPIESEPGTESPTAAPRQRISAPSFGPSLVELGAEDAPPAADIVAASHFPGANDTTTVEEALDSEFGGDEPESEEPGAITSWKEPDHGELPTDPGPSLFPLSGFQVVGAAPPPQTMPMTPARSDQPPSSQGTRPQPTRPLGTEPPAASPAGNTAKGAGTPPKPSAIDQSSPKVKPKVKPDAALPQLGIDVETMADESREAVPPSMNAGQEQVATPDSTAYGSGPQLGAGQIVASRYKVTGVMGNGSLGMMYEAVDQESGNRVAVTALDMAAAERRGGWKAFGEKIKVVGSLANPNIIKIVAMKRDGGSYFVVTEPLQGETLSKVIERRRPPRKPFGVDEVNRVGKALCEALETAHKQGVDFVVSPDTVWMCPDGRLKLTDFGFGPLGVPVSETDGAWPEDRENRAEGASDARTDQVRVAAVLYEMLTRVSAVQRTKPARAIRSDVPRMVSAALERAMSDDPSKRFKDVEAFTKAMTSGAFYTDKLIGAVVGGLALAVVVVGVGIWFALKPPEPTPGPDRGGTRQAAPVPAKTAGEQRPIKTSIKPTTDQSYRLAMAQGKADLDFGKYADAKKRFEDALKHKPGDEEAGRLLNEVNVGLTEHTYQASIQLGYDQLKAGRWEPAEKAFQEALNIRKNDAEAQKGLKKAVFGRHMAQATAFFQERKYEQSLKSFQAALAAFPDDKGAQKGLSQAKEELYKSAMSEGARESEKRDFAAAERAFKRALEWKPNDEDAKHGLSAAHSAASDGDQAKHIALGRELLAASKIKPAMEAFRKALEIRPGDKAALEGLESAKDKLYGAAMEEAERQLGAKNAGAAREAYNEALKWKPEDLRAKQGLDNLKKSEVPATAALPATPVPPPAPAAPAEPEAPSQPVPTAPPKGTVEVAVDPATAEIFASVDGSEESWGRADDSGVLLRSDVPVGKSFSVSAKKKGWKSRSVDNVTLNEADQVLKVGPIKLERERASLVIRSGEAKARVQVGDKVLESGEDGVVSLADLEIGVQQDIVITKPGFKKQELAVTIPDDYAGRTYEMEPVSLVRIRAGGDRGLNEALVKAATAGQSKEVERLLAEGADSNSKDEDKTSALTWACNGGHVDAAKMLLDSGADPNMKDKFGAGPLMWAARGGSAELVDLLLGKGVDPDLRDDSGSTALMWAVAESKTDAMKVLLQKGADANARNKDGDTALIYAGELGTPDAARLLIEKGVDVNAVGSSGKTALYVTAERPERFPVAKLLIERGADIEAATDQKWTPLVAAADAGNVELVALLLEKGAKTQIKLALQMASLRENKDVLELLRKHGGK